MRKRNSNLFFSVYLCDCLHSFLIGEDVADGLRILTSLKDDLVYESNEMYLYSWLLIYLIDMRRGLVSCIVHILIEHFIKPW